MLEIQMTLILFNNPRTPFCIHFSLPCLDFFWRPCLPQSPSSWTCPCFNDLGVFAITMIPKLQWFHQISFYLFPFKDFAFWVLFLPLHILWTTDLVVLHVLRIKSKEHPPAIFLLYLRFIPQSGNPRLSSHLTIPFMVTPWYLSSYSSLALNNVILPGTWQLLYAH